GPGVGGVGGEVGGGVGAVAGGGAVARLAGDAAARVVGVGVVGEQGAVGVAVLQIAQPVDHVIRVAGATHLHRAGQVAVTCGRGHHVVGVVGEVLAQRRRAVAELAHGQVVGLVVGRGGDAALGVLHLRAVAHRVIGERQRQAERLVDHGGPVEGVVAEGVGAVAVGRARQVGVAVVAVGEGVRRRPPGVVPQRRRAAVVGVVTVVDAPAVPVRRRGQVARGVVGEGDAVAQRVGHPRLAVVVVVGEGGDVAAGVGHR